jgi:hypothetical protein
MITAIAIYFACKKNDSLQTNKDKNNSTVRLISDAKQYFESKENNFSQNQTNSISHHSKFNAVKDLIKMLIGTMHQ